MPDALLTPELLRRLEQFQLLATRRAKSSSKGERRSRARGQSVEFADYRTYVHGDDFRYLDWNLYGRLERLFLKLYEDCLLYTSPSPRDGLLSRMPSSA